MPDAEPLLNPEQTAWVAAAVPLAKRTARYHARRYRDLADDFESDYLWGLCLAAQSFDPAQGVKFSTYCKAQFRSARNNAMRKNRPRGFRKSRSLTPRRTAPAVGTMTAADQPAWHDRDRLVEREAADWLGRAVRTLSRRSSEVLTLRYGLDDGVRLSCPEVGKRLGLTKQRVGQIEAEAVRALRRAAEVAPVNP